MDTDYNQKLYRIIRALNHPVRIKILYYLSDHGKSNVTNLVNQVNISQPAVSRHLRILADAQLITSQQSGKEKLYQLTDEHVNELLKVLHSHIEEQID
ncbi:metalloregulator ArsR/SmtB family transcription factor (plasmid) [Nicoliella spurrieriana]|uniref:Metalloregulator ArsR/SmtB family transcription factor n=1 Tax=Nicoliella spurrieriana TaxID=2925830 RepID=A0A976X4Y9_9LACO|nr:metalloregulator ArsR/SmtB family transcription factor [Nicoliella spurrieriana]UQS86071.1 metalloregulator ArsR/SmtB family transcription factor [Nicoliella spurrieriana]